MADYESPVKIIYGQMQTQFEDDILKAVQSYHIEVNKEELLKALRYDREQFDKGHAVGYADGYGDACAEAKRPKWISVEDRLPEFRQHVIVYDELAVGEAYWNGKIFEWVADENIAFATHWMPLPEPPTTKEVASDIMMQAQED